MSEHEVRLEVRGPWGLGISRAFWEGFAPAALAGGGDADTLTTTFVSDHDWSTVRAEVRQEHGTAVVRVSGPGDLDAAAAQVARFLSLDIDATDWPEVGRRDPVIGEAQRRLPGFRPCGFHSPYEAAAWSVLSQRVRITQAAAMRRQLIAEHGVDGAFPVPAVLRSVDFGAPGRLHLPGRKGEYLHAVAEAALEGLLDGATLRSMPTAEALASVKTITGIGPFAAELIVLRGANAPDVLPLNEARLNAEITELYGADADVEAVADAWRPFRSWAAVHLRALREIRLGGSGMGTGLRSAAGRAAGAAGVGGAAAVDGSAGVAGAAGVGGSA